MPSSLEAERALLGGILMDPSVMDALVKTIEARHFFGDVNRKIWEAIHALWVAGKPIDLLLLAAQLERRGQLERIGGNEPLMEIANAAVSAAGLTHYADILRSLSLRRDIILSAAAIQEDAFTHVGDAHELADRVGSKLMDLVRPESRRQAQPLKAGLKEAVSHLERISKSGWLGLPTGLTDLDNITGGMQAGDLIVLAARPSMGKTALALGVAVHAAKEGRKVRIVSLEMSLEQVAMRLLSMQGGVSLQQLSRSRLDAAGWKAVADADSELCGLPIMIDDGDASIQSVRHDARRAIADKSAGLDLLIVDYLGLLSTAERHDNREQTVASMSRALKLLAKELSIPVLLVCQLNRAVESRIDKRPHLSDLRESGAIEQDADMIWFIYRDEVYNPNTTDKGTAEIGVAKHRNGPIGIIKVQFDAASTNFKNLYRRQNSDADETY
jgi:replicative DNA helicase